MGQSIKAKIDGADINQARLGASSEDQLEAPINDLFHNGNFITLKDMVKKAVIIVSDDPTATARTGSDTGYDEDNSGVLIKFADADGNVIADGAGGDTIITDVHLFVNLAGTADADQNLPYDPGTPFYYILMDHDTASLDATDRTVDMVQFPTGILATNDGGPQAEVSVILPQDGEE